MVCALRKTERKRRKARFLVNKKNAQRKCTNERRQRLQTLLDENAGRHRHTERERERERDSELQNGRK